MGIVMRSLALGCAQFGHGYGLYVKTPELSSIEVGEILELAKDVGIEALDLAQGYEGAILKLSATGLTDRFKLGTKIKFRDSNIDLIAKSLTMDLQALNSRKYESILIHDWSELTVAEKEAGLSFLVDLRNQGIAKSIGISVYDKSELIALTEKLDIVQAPLNFFNSEFLLDDTARNLAKNGVSFHARSIFHQGTLLNTETIKKDYMNEAKCFEDYCESHSLSRLQGALSIFDSQDLFSKLIVGVASTSQLLEISSSPVNFISSMLDEVPTDLSRELVDPRKWSAK
jgi:aryl-alcohol dehydrogenase-like predicted oxidoreductase